MSRLFRMAVAPLAAVMLLVNLARADVMSLVPGEAMFVVKVNDMKQASDKFAKFATDLGLAMMVPPLQDPIGALQQQMGIKNGVNVNGEFAFVFVDPSVVGDNPENAVMMLIPVSDYNAFVNTNGFTDVATEGDIASFNLPNGGPKSYTMKWGDYAAIAPAPDILKIKPTGLKPTGVPASELKKDVVFYANMATIRAKAQPELAKARDEILSELEQGLANEPEVAKFAPAIRAFVSRLMDVADGFLRDASGATVALNFVPEGVNMSLVCEFTQGTYMANVLSSAKNTDASFTRGMPAGKYLVFGGSTGDPEQTAKMISDFSDPILVELKKVGGEQASAIDNMYQNLMKYVRAAESQSFGLMAPPPGTFGQGALLQGFSIYNGDAQAMKTAYVEMSRSQEALMAAFGVPAEQFRYNIKPNGKTVGGVAFDEITSDFKFAAGDPSAPEAEQMMKILYGPEGMKFLIGALDDRTLVQSFGLPDAALTQVIDAVKGKQDPMAALPGVQAVNKQIPAKRLGVLYVPIDEVVNTGLTVAREFGAGLNVQMQPDLPPLVISVASEGTALRIDSHAPTQLVSQLFAAGFQIAMQMQQGGGGRRGPGGL